MEKDLITTLPDPKQVRSLSDLSGRVALVTGGGSGLGRAMAWGLACQGADIVIVDQALDRAKECATEIEQGTGRRVRSYAADVSSEREVNQAVSAALADMGRIDVLLNNAGHNIRKPTIEFTQEEFDSLHAVHVRGAFLFCKAIAKHMQERGSGSIINVASILGLVAAPGVAPYSAAKAAVASFSRVLALEMAPFNVRVNSIAPGYVDTPLTRTHPDHVRRAITENTPLGRFGMPNELIGPLLFLASDASTFVTGSTLVVDGGWTAR